MCDTTRYIDTKIKLRHPKMNENTGGQETENTVCHSR